SAASTSSATWFVSPRIPDRSLERLRHYGKSTMLSAAPGDRRRDRGFLMQVRTSFVRAASVGVALLTGAVVVPTAAQAASYTSRVATHDVQRFDFSTDAFSRADHNQRADITPATFTFTRHTLTTVLHLRSGSIGDQWA